MPTQRATKAPTPLAGISHVQRAHAGRLLVDFNYAYSPYCAYNESWICPLTPFENRLAIQVRAGEKDFK